MEKVHSRYRLFGDFGLLIVLNGLIGIGTHRIVFDSDINYKVVDLLNDSEARYVYLVILGLQSLFLILFMTQCKYIIIDENEISFVNPLFPILRRKLKWSDYDYWVFVDEHSRGKTHEAIWLIKDNKVRDRFSSFYYSNYSKLKNKIERKVKGKGKLRIGPFGQLTSILGMKIAKPNKA
ncbi:MAG: hypothetical protein ACLFT3_18790 [Cyclobacteriaceae bacterium]